MSVEQDKIKQTIAKVKALAEQGIDGEKVSANLLLDKLLKKYDIDISDIENLGIESREMSYSKKDQDSIMILSQCIFSVVGKVDVFVLKRKYRLRAELSNDNYIEIMIKYKYYLKLYQEQKGLFQQAFVQRNQLYSIPTPEELIELKKNIPELTPEASINMVKMMHSLEKGDYESQASQKIKKIEA